MTREITDQTTAMDEPGPGGANHQYRIGVDNERYICSQNGPINGNGVNGITQEVLIAIYTDRLRSFLTKLEGVHHTRENMSRGFYGETVA